MIKRCDNREEVLILFATDSLANPRVWNIHNEENNLVQKAVQYTKTYPLLLEKKLKEKYPEYIIMNNVYSQRGSGWGTGTVKSKDFFALYFPKDHHADITIFQYGISECWIKDNGKPRVNTVDFENNIQAIMEDKEKYDPNSITIFVSILPTIQKYIDKQPKQNELISEWNQIIKNNLIKNCYFADIEEYFYANKELQEEIVHPDGHHLNIMGHEVFAEVIFKTIINIKDGE